MYICYGKLVFLVSLAYRVSMYVLLRAWTFHVNRLGLCIFTSYYPYLPKIHISRNIYTMYVCVVHKSRDWILVEDHEMPFHIIPFSNSSCGVLVVKSNFI